MFMQQFQRTPADAPRIVPPASRPAEWFQVAGSVNSDRAAAKPPVSLVSSEARLNAILDASPDGVVLVDRKGYVTEVNPAGLELFEAASLLELATAPLGGFISAGQQGAYAEALETLWTGRKSVVEFECTGLHGRIRWIEMHAAPIRDEKGEVNSFLAILRDATALRDLQRQFIQAQKMEVVGHLAGGVAHDFNNMLGIIMGFSEMLLDSAAPGSRHHEDALAIFHTAERAAALTRQILIFSRNRTPQAQEVDMGAIIVEMDRMLRRLIGETISLVTRPEPDLGLVEADPVQIEQVLMNLTVNARDAMPAGGTITIETSNATIYEGDEAHPGAKPGKYAVLSVADTGDGMTEEVRSKIFEAFFTTKPAGHGTGLGLSTCHGIVQQWGGHIVVESTPGAGSIFKVFLPCVQRSVKPMKTAAPGGPLPRGVETILLVEDEAGLLALTSVVLERQGYTVLKAGNGNEALALVHERRSGAIDLVMTDMVMPEMGGRMMAEWLHAFDPKIKVLFTSGYTDVGHGGGIEKDMDFIAKPYTPSDLLRKVRDVIDRAGAQPAAQTPQEPAQ
jgi:PAS domain S-box-containing protein